MNIARYSLDATLTAFPALAASRNSRASIHVGEEEYLTADDLHLPIFSPVRSVIEMPAGGDGSKDVLRCAGDLMRAGYSDEQIFGVLMNPNNSVSAHLLRQDDPRRAALRAIEKVRGDAAISPSGFGYRQDTNQPPAPLEFLDVATFAGVEVPEMLWAIRDTIPTSQTTLFTGQGSAGKSLVGLQLCAAVALGRPVFGLETTQCKAAYISAEDDDEEHHRRIVRIANAMGVSLEAFTEKFFVKSLIERLDKGMIRIDQDGEATVLRLYHELKSGIEELGLGFVVLDNVAHFFEGNENIRAHVARFVGLLNALALETGCAIVLVAHPNKGGASYSGSTAWQNQVRSHILLNIDEADRDRRFLIREKANYAGRGEPIVLRFHRGSFRLEDDVPPGESTRSTILDIAHEQRFLACLDRRNIDRQPVSSKLKSRTYAPKIFAEMREAEGATTDELSGAMRRLIDDGRIVLRTLNYDKPSSAGHKAIGLDRVDTEEVDNDPM
jgi:RecA-family ATPase